MKYLEMLGGSVLFFLSWLVYFDHLATLGWWVPLAFMAAGIFLITHGVRQIVK